MVRLIFEEPQDAQWTAWRAKCETETDRFIQAVSAGQGARYKVSDLYKDKPIKKKYYFNDDFRGPFWRKCAYCEESIGAQNGDVEHFRPKKAVSNHDRVQVQGHNGYYWLAYHWKNLLPCCEKCNRLQIWDKTEGKFWVGKQDRFPLEDDTTRVFSHTDDISTEKTSLINPLIEDPEEHLSVELKTGIMVWSSNRGKACVDMFGLNIRDDLRDGRKTAIKAMRSLLSDMMNYVENDDGAAIRAVTTDIFKYVNGEKRFSLAAKCYLKKFMGDDYKGRLERLLAEYPEN